MGLLSILIGLLATVFSAFLIRDLYACTGQFQRWILRFACRLVPLEQRDEKYKQWHADLSAIAPSEILRTLYALDCVRAAAAIGLNSKRTYATAKRLLDALIALPMLFLIVPLFLGLAFAIKIETRGPIFFKQTRRGLRGRTFEILKFRTMRVASDDAGDPNDRVTRVGAWLRTFSLDELPQLLNVISGEMSLVGPRPMAVDHGEQVSIDCPDFDLRYAVKPGITGWAQVNRERGRSAISPLTELKQQLRDDLYYARNHSTKLDCLILLKTAVIILGLDASLDSIDGTSDW